jgi:NAD-dependent deacetylase
MDINISKAAEIIQSAKYVIALTGAGVSTESGIPDFRSQGGLWDVYDPAEYATIEAFHETPEKVWEMNFAMGEITKNAKPNSGHKALAELEKLGLLKCIITQNIDNLHQEAGSKCVIEYHGNSSHLECLSCGKKYGRDEFAANTKKKIPPRCKKCKSILKPSVIYFGEMIPHEAVTRSQEAAQKADAVMVIGTSAVVYPAAGIPLIAKQHNAVIIEFNTEETGLTGSATDIFVLGKVGTTLPELVRQIKSA